MNALVTRLPSEKLFAASIHIGSPGSALKGIKIAPFSENIPHPELLRSYLEPSSQTKLEKNLISCHRDLKMLTFFIFSGSLKSLDFYDSGKCKR